MNEAEALEHLQKVIAAHPEVAQAAFSHPDLPEEARPTVDLVRAKLAGADFSLDAFRHFYPSIYDGKELPKHAEKWAKKMFEVFNRQGVRGLLNKASRGLTKSSVGIGFCLFLHGHFPHKSGLISQARDIDAKKTAKFMSDTISSAAGWRAAFSHIVPDVERGWSLDGYYIKDDRVPYDQWVKRTTGDHGRDPSFVAVSIVSGAIGMHPTLYLMLDDIHDQKNSASDAEKTNLKNTLKSDVLPTMSNPGGAPFLCVSYTPWGDDDAYTVLEESGIFDKIVTPAFVYDEDGADVWDGRKITLTWPNNADFSVEALERWRHLLGKREFGRMFLCDLEVGRGESLRYYSYDPDVISYDWPAVGGADPTNVYQERHEDIKKKSYFALCYMAKIPQGGAVVVDGVLKDCSQLEAENYIARAQTLFPRWQYTQVENSGGGSGFIQTLRRNSDLRIISSDLTDLNKRLKKIRKKEDRILIELAPWLENGTIRISSANTDFLNAVRKGLDRFYELSPNDPAWDALDSVYHAAKGMPDVLNIVKGDELPHTYETRRKSPFEGRLALRRR